LLRYRFFFVKFCIEQNTIFKTKRRKTLLIFSRFDNRLKNNLLTNKIARYSLRFKIIVHSNNSIFRDTVKIKWRVLDVENLPEIQLVCGKSSDPHKSAVNYHIRLISCTVDSHPASHRVTFCSSAHQLVCTIGRIRKKEKKFPIKVLLVSMYNEKRRWDRSQPLSVMRSCLSIHQVGATTCRLDADAPPRFSLPSRHHATRRSNDKNV